MGRMKEHFYWLIEKMGFSEMEEESPKPRITKFDKTGGKKDEDSKNNYCNRSLLQDEEDIIESDCSK